MTWTEAEEAWTEARRRPAFERTYWTPKPGKTELQEVYHLTGLMPAAPGWRALFWLDEADGDGVRTVSPLVAWGVFETHDIGAAAMPMQFVEALIVGGACCLERAASIANFVDVLDPTQADDVYDDRCRDEARTAREIAARKTRRDEAAS